MRRIARGYSRAERISEKLPRAVKFNLRADGEETTREKLMNLSKFLSVVAIILIVNHCIGFIQAVVAHHT